MTHILLLGGGFGGLYAALELDRRLGGDPDVRVTLVNRDNFFLFTPMLHEVAASDLDLTAIVSPIRRILRRVDFFEGSVEAIDLRARRVVVAHGSDGHTHELAYDLLVIGLGSTTNFHGLRGLEERALTMKSLSDAVRLRNRLIAHMEEAGTPCAHDNREALMTFVVAGGGFAGVETIAAINDFVRAARAFYPRIGPEDIRMVLVHSGPVLLPELGEKLGRYAQRKLAARSIEIHTNARIRSVDDDFVTLSTGEVIRSNTVIWTAGTSPHPLVARLPCATERGRIRVDEFLEVPEWPGVWALGDCAAIPDRRTGGFHPPTAQHAVREGRLAAHNIVASIRGGRKRPFEFRGLGQLAAIGHRTGVAKIFGFTFSGFFAWWLWRTVYLSKLPRLEKKVRVALDWTLDLLFKKDFVQYFTPRPPAISHDRGAPEHVGAPAAVGERSSATII